MKRSERLSGMIVGLGLLVGCSAEGPALDGEGGDGNGVDGESDTGELESDSGTPEPDMPDMGVPEPDMGAPESFELVAATIESPTTILLTFSHPVDSLEGVDADAFRISYGHSAREIVDGNEYAWTWYVDPNIFMFDADCEELYGNTCTDFEPFVMLGVEPGPIPEQLRLITSALDDAACDKINYGAGFPLEPPFVYSETHLFPHYAPGETPLRSTSGLELAAIGPEWVLFEGDPNFLGGGSLDVDGWGFENLDPQVPIPCD